MAILIGCSGSTGSSLLKTILNRHSQLFAGPEAGLFAFPQVYDNWAENKHQLLTTIKTDAWQLRKGMNLLQPAFGWQEKELQQLIQKSTSFQEFVPTFFKHTLQQQNKQYWVAKTPANAIGMTAFLEHFPAGKAIQTVRNPYDTITSLMARGMNAYQATAYYVFNTAAATANYQHQRYYHLKYEDLVAEPTETLRQLFDFLELNFEPKILIAKHEKRAEPTAMKGWKHEETAAVKASSIGRFSTLTEEKQALVYSAFSTFNISKSYQKKWSIPFNSGAELCAVLGYNYVAGEVTKHRFLLKKYLWRDRLSRIKHGFWWQFFDYVGDLER
ncbi:MAG: sulfotransferase [Saprospiraceae bacterium]